MSPTFTAFLAGFNYLAATLYFICGIFSRETFLVAAAVYLLLIAESMDADLRREKARR